MADGQLDAICHHNKIRMSCDDCKREAEERKKKAENS